MYEEKVPLLKDRRAVTALVIVFFVGLLVGWLLSGSPQVEVPVDEDDEVAEETEEGSEEEAVLPNDEEGAAQADDDSIEVDDQPAGSVVVISRMDLADIRWVVVHEDSEGDLGNILGARLFAETHTEGEVALQRATGPGGTYHVVLYAVAERNEDRGRIFDPGRDVPLVEEGDLVRTSFVAQ